jgi:hypothetical protein
MKKVLQFGALVLLAGASIYNLTLQPNESKSFIVQLNNADALSQNKSAQKAVDIGSGESLTQWGDTYIWETWDYNTTSCFGSGNVDCTSGSVITNRKAVIL